MKAGTRKNRAALVAVAAAIASFAASAAPASAGVLVSTAQSCAKNTLTQPFKGFGDNASYAQLPGGTFEDSSAGWALGGGAKIVSGTNEPWKVNSGTDSHALSLPAGGVATSPAMCVGLAEPTLRYFSKSSSLLGLTGAMTVEVLTETSLGAVVAVPLAPGLLSSSWTPGLLPTPIVANLLPLLPDSKTAVAFRFRAVSGNWTLDDVYVDPYRSI